MACILVALLIVLAALAPAAAHGTVDPTGQWPTGTPEAHGFDSAKLADALLAIQKDVPDVHSVLLVRAGEIVVDAAFYP